MLGLIKLAARMPYNCGNCYRSGWGNVRQNTIDIIKRVRYPEVQHCQCCGVEFMESHPSPCIYMWL